MKEQIKNFEEKIIGLQNNVEFKLNIEYIQSEANKLDFNKYQPEKKDNIYEKKFKELEEKHIDLTEELQKYKRESLGHEEIVKEKDERIARIKHSLEELQNNYRSLDKQHSLLKLDHERLIQTSDEQSSELESTIHKLKVTNKVRNENEIKLTEAKDREKEIKAFLSEKEDRLQKYLVEIQKLEK